MRVAESLGGEGGDDLDEAHVGVGESGAVAERAEENRADRHGPPRDRHDRNRLDAAIDQLALDVLERRVVRRVGNEHGLAALHRLLQLRVALQIDQVIADRGIFVGGDEPHLPPALFAEKDGAAVQPERLAELAGDGLQNVNEV